MAWLERKGTKYRIRFRFGGRKHLVVLKTTKERDANGSLARFEENLRLAERGRLVIPDDADVGLFLLSDGKLNQRPTDERLTVSITMAELFAQYRANSPNGAKEEITRYTERIHIAHLERLIGGSTSLQSITAKMLQGYVTARSREKGKRGRTISTQTIKKELGTLTAVWNQWAIQCVSCRPRRPPSVPGHRTSRRVAFVLTLALDHPRQRRDRCRVLDSHVCPVARISARPRRHPPPH